MNIIRVTHFHNGQSGDAANNCIAAHSLSLFIFIFGKKHGGNTGPLVAINKRQ